MKMESHLMIIEQWTLIQNLRDAEQKVNHHGWCKCDHHSAKKSAQRIEMKEQEREKK